MQITRSYYTRLIALFLALGFFSAGPVAAGISPATTLEQKAETASRIVMGRLLDQEPFEDAKGRINTVNILEVTAWLKGFEQTDRVAVLTSGGKLDDRIEIVSGAVSLRQGQEYVLFLDDEAPEGYHSTAGEAAHMPQAFIYGSSQGLMVYDKNGFYRALDGPSIPEVDLLQELTGLTGEEALRPNGRPFEARPAVAQPAALQSEAAKAGRAVSPTTVPAGTVHPDHHLTITGSGFGATPGAVTFTAVNGSLFDTVAPEIISWSDTQVVTQVPGDAASGSVYINDITVGSITVPYALGQFEYNGLRYSYLLFDMDGKGGMTYQYHNNFAANTTAVAAFERAVNTWRCSNAYAPFNIDQAAATTAYPVQDGQNTIAWEDLPGGTLGEVRWRLSPGPTGCDGADRFTYALELDVAFDITGSTAGWHFGEAAPPANKYDFESVAVHEVGHALGLTHVNDSNAVMRASGPPGEMIRTPKPVEVEGVDLFVNRDACWLHSNSQGPMRPLQPGSCLLGSESCSFSLNLVHFDVSGAGSTDLAIAVTGADGCDWDVQNTASWITYTATGSGAAAGEVHLNVASNSGDARSATLSVAGIAVTVNQAAGTPPPPPPPEPVLYFFDANLDDSSAGDLHGTFAGAPALSYKEGIVGLAVEVSGGDSRMELPHTILDNMSAFGVSLWLKTTSANATLPLLWAGSESNPNGFLLALVDGAPFASAGAETISAPNLLNDGEWHHLLFTQDPAVDTAHLYVDGAMVRKRTALTPSLEVDPGGLMAFNGLTSLTGGAPIADTFTGCVDQMRIYREVIAPGLVRVLLNEYAPLATRTSHYSFSGNLNDSSINEEHGREYGRPPLAYKTGVIGQALQVSAGESRMALANSALNHAGDFSLSMWLKTEVTGYAAIVSGYSSTYADDLVFGLQDGKPQFWSDRAGGEVLTAPDSINDNTWRHVVMVRDAVAAKVVLYVDGQKVAEGPGSSYAVDIAYNGLLLFQEQDWVGGGFSLNQAYVGCIDELRIHREALTDAQVADLFTEPDGLIELLNHYAFDGNLTDSSAKEHHGTAVNPIEFSYKPGAVGEALYWNGGGTARIQLPREALLGAGDFSLSVWIQTDRPTDFNAILNAHTAAGADEINFGLRNGKPTFWSFSGGFPELTGPDVVNDNTWRHLALVRNIAANEVVIYVDGQRVAEAPGYSKMVDIDPGGLILLHEQDSVGGGFESFQGYVGCIDEFRIHREALTDTQVAELFAEAEPNYYAFDGNAEDSSANAAHASLGGAIPPTFKPSGVLGEALVNNSDSGVVHLPAETLNGAGDFGLSMWVKTSSQRMNFLLNGTADGAIGGQDHFNLNIFQNKIYYGFNHQVVLHSTTEVNDDQWHHVALTRDNQAAVVSLYIDGQLEAEVTGAATNLLTIDPNSLVLFQHQNALGGTTFFNDQWFDGCFDQLRIYREALTDTKVAELFAERPPAPTEPSYYAFDGNLNDSSTNQYHGVESGAPPLSYKLGVVGPALNSDGGTASITLPREVLLGAGDFSFSTWVKTSATGTRIILSGFNSAGDELNFGVQDGLPIFWSFTGNAQIVGPDPINDNTWRHVALVRNAATSRLVMYVDGQRAAEEVGYTAPVAIDPGGLVLLQEQDSAGGGFEVDQAYVGCLDQLRIHREALTDAQVAQLFTEGNLNPNHYAFDGNADDSSNNAAHASLGGAVPPAFKPVGAIGAALENRSDSGVVHIPAETLNGAGDFGLSMWVKTGSQRMNFLLNGTADGAIGGQNHFNLNIYQNKIYYGFNHLVVLHSTTEVNDDRWHHVALTRDNQAGVVSLYINGQLEAEVTGAATNLLTIDPNSLVLFQHQTAPGGTTFLNDRWFDGCFDQLRIYRKPIDAALALELYEERPQTGDAVYSFEGNADDSSGSGYHAMLNGTPNPYFKAGVVGQGLFFPGGTSRVLVPGEVVHTASDFSFVMWVKPKLENGTLITTTNEAAVTHRLELENGEPVYHESVGLPGALSIRATQTLPLNTWSHLAFVRDGASGLGSFYINGRLTANGRAGSAPASAPRVALGQDFDTTKGDFSGNRFVGWMDEVQFFRRTLSAEDAAQMSTGLSVPYASYPFSNGLAAATPADGSLDGRPLGTPETVSGHLDGSVLQLQAPGDAVLLPGSILDGAEDFTISFWLDARTLDVALLTADDQFDNGYFEFYISGEGSLLAHLGGSFLTASTPLTNQGWKQVTVTRRASDGRVEVFVDGVLETLSRGTPNLGVGPMPIVTDLVLGASNYDTTEYDSFFDGRVDNLAFYNSILTPEQIAAGAAEQNCASPIHSTVQVVQATRAAAAELTVTLYDGMGRPMSAGADWVQLVHVHNGVSTELDVTNNNDGTYTAQVTPLLGDNYVHAYLNGEELADSPVLLSNCAAPPPPNAPSVTADASGIALTWSPVAGADSYNIYRAIGACGSEGSYTLIAEGLVDANYLDARVAGGTTYSYAVASRSGGCASAQSACASAEAQPCPNPLPFSDAVRVGDMDRVGVLLPHVLSVDANGDGRQDMIQYGDGEILLWMGNGLDYDAPAPINAVSDLVKNVAAGDLNGDNRQDLVVYYANRYPTVYLNTGVAPFYSSGAELVSNVIGSRSGNIVDVDQDGDLDVLYHIPSGSGFVSKNNGAGVFSHGNVFYTEGATNEMVFIQRDGDGYPDLLPIANFQTSIYNNLQSNPFYNFASSSTAFQGYPHGKSAAVADVNGDGYDDVVLGLSTSANVYLNDGVGNMAPSSALDSGGELVSQVTAEDLNADGLVDVVLVTSTSMYLYMNQGAPNRFNATADMTLSHSTSGGRITAADANGDGLPDLIAGQTPLRIWYNQGGGQPTIPSATTLTTASCVSGVGVVTLQTRDCRGTARTQGGDTVVLTVTGANSATVTATDNGDGTYTAAYDLLADGEDFYSVEVNGVALNDLGSAPVYTQIFSDSITVDLSNPAPGNSFDIASGDMNNDGLVDLVAAQLSQPMLIYIHNGSSPPYSDAPIQLGAADDHRRIHLADIDRDGRLDVLAAVNGESKLYRQEAPATAGQVSFRAAEIINTAGPLDSYMVAAVQADADAELEVLLMSLGQSTVLYNYNSAGGFSVHGAVASTPLSVGYGSIRTADLDGDGDQDVVAQKGETGLEVLINDPSAPQPFTVQSLPALSGTASQREIALGDVNGDGHVDIVGCRYGAEPFIYLNDGAASFSLVSAFGGVTPEAVGLALGDFNNDQTVDVFLSDANTGEHHLLLNKGGLMPEWTAATGPDLGAGVQRLASADFNGDGVLDLAAAVHNQPRYILNSLCPTSAENVTAVVPNGFLGSPTNILIQAFDASGNPVTSGGADVAVTVTGANTATPTVYDNGDGSYTASYLPTAMGQDSVAITFNGTPVPNSPFASLVTDNVDPALSQVVVPNGIVGEPTHLTVQLYDSSGQPMTSGGHDVTVNLSGAVTKAATIVTDNGDGTYSHSFVPTEGITTIEVLLNNELVGGTTFTSLALADIFTDGRYHIPAGFAAGLVANASSALAADMNGDGLMDLVVSAANYTRIHLNNGTPLPFSESASLLLAHHSDQVRQIQVLDANRDGRQDLIMVFNTAAPRLSLQRAPTTPGSLSFKPAIELNTDGESLQKVYVIEVDGDPLPEFLMLRESGSRLNIFDFDGVSQVTFPHSIDPGSLFNLSLTVEAVDLNGDGFDDLAATGDGAEPKLLLAMHSGDTNNPYPTMTALDTIPAGSRGVTAADYNQDGHLDLMVAAPDSSTRLYPGDGTGSFAPAQSFGPALESSRFSVGDLNKDGLPDLVAGDLNGTDVVVLLNRGGPRPFDQATALTYSGMDFMEFGAVADFNGDGAMDAGLVRHDNGLVYMNTGFLGNADLSTALVPNGSQGVPLTITIQARDLTGAARPVGGDTVTVEVSGANNLLPTVVDNNDGTYSVTYRPSAIGTDTIAVTMNGSPLQGSPFTAEILGGVSPAHSTALVPGGIVNQTTEIVIQARDNQGNALQVGGESLVVSVSGAQNLSPQVSDNGDGTYTARYTPYNDGVDTIEIFMNGEPIQGNPFTSLINRAPVAVDDQVYTAVNTPVTFSVVANDYDPTRSLDLTSVQTAVYPNFGALVNNGDGTMSYTPNTDFAGVDSFTYVIVDDAGLMSNQARVTIAVSNQPTAVNDTVRIFDTAEVILTPLSNDIAGGSALDPATLQVIGSPAGTLVNLGNGTLSYTPDPVFKGTTLFTYTVRDVDSVTSNTAVFYLLVQAPPTAVDDQVGAGAGVDIPLDPTANDTDPDGLIDPSTIQFLTTPTKGMVSNIGGVWIYSADAGATGVDSFTYRVADNDGNWSNVATITVTLSTPPTAVEDFISVYTKYSNTVSVLANDTSEAGLDPYSIEILVQPAHGSASLTHGDYVVYTPTQTDGVFYTGPDSFSYRVADVNGVYSAPVVVNLEVYFYIPDPAFKAHLLQYDLNGDNELRPDEVIGVTDINVSNMGITDLKGIEFFTDLVTLNASRNNINTHVSFGKLVNLEVVNLSFNSLSRIPDLFFARSLHTLNLHHNNITNMGPDDTLGETLVSLDMSSNQLTDMPFVYTIDSLLTLNISSNPISSIELYDLPDGLRGLTAFNMKLTEFPDLTRLANLSLLHLQYNLIETLPDPLPVNDFLGTGANHQILLDHNLLTSDACPSLTPLIERVNLSGALLSYEVQGNIFVQSSQLAVWPDVFLLDFIDALNQDNFLNQDPLPCQP